MARIYGNGWRKPSDPIPSLILPLSAFNAVVDALEAAAIHELTLAEDVAAWLEPIMGRVDAGARLDVALRSIR